MHDRDWKLEYRRVVERPSDAPAHLPDQERRRDPRLPLPSQRLLLHSDPVMLLSEYSGDGFTFESLHALPVGVRFPVRRGGAGLSAAQVEECRMVETDGALLECRYRVRCTILEQRGDAGASSAHSAPAPAGAEHADPEQAQR